MDAEQLATWRRLAEAASPGPWHACYQPSGPCGAMQYADAVVAAGSTRIVERPHPTYRGAGRAARDAEFADGRFIAAAREAVPALLDEVDRLRAERDRPAGRSEREIEIEQQLNAFPAEERDGADHAIADLLALVAELRTELEMVRATSTAPTPHTSKRCCRLPVEDEV